MKALALKPDRAGFESWLHYFQLCDLGQHTELLGACDRSSLGGEVSAL